MSRYFLGKDAGNVIREKQIFAGDESKADAAIAAFLALPAHAGWTAPEVDAATFAAAVVATDQTKTRAKAIANLESGASSNDKLLRALLLLIIDEFNLLRQRDRDRSVDVAASTSLADLKTRWAARSSLADRTTAQLKTAIQNKINDGTAD